MISVCIATHERSLLIETTLEHLAKQTLYPMEIVISDSSIGDTSQKLIEDFAKKHPVLSIKYIRSERRALPWQRWLAFTQSSGEIILYLDDDVKLSPKALSTLQKAYDNQGHNVSGIGFIMTIESEKKVTHNDNFLKNKLYGIYNQAPGTISPGGLTISHWGLELISPIVEVEWLCGGAMSYRRKILENIGPLDNLFILYDEGIGKGEDGILSFEARKYGNLYILTDALAYHPPLSKAIRTANSHNGYKKGLLDTWGRAHIMRWEAKNPLSWRKSSLRYAFLQVFFRVLKVVTQPFKKDNWNQMWGTLVGLYRLYFKYHTIPFSPQQKKI